MKNSDFTLTAALETLPNTDRAALDTLLLESAAAGNAATVAALLNAGAGIDSKDRYERTALHLAARGGHSAVVELLTTKGAAVDAKSRYGWTPLHHAAKRGYSTVVELLHRAEDTSPQPGKPPAMDDIRMALEALQNG